jgi:16S rRNA (adenine1518-N6/adenine1519-N6)-dimethyltransferase
MAQTKGDILALLAQAGTRPHHRFGQNFMIDQNLVRLVAEAGMIQSGDRVIEVGPGTGTLTEEILARGAHVLAVEIDHDLADLLRFRFASEPRFLLIQGDALKNKHSLHPELESAIAAAQAAGQPVKLVANLTYNIASPLVIDLLLEGVSRLAFTVQKEVADRLRAPADSDAYGPLSVMAQLLAEVEVLRILPPQAFWPAPKIESALVRLTLRNQLGAVAVPFGVFVQKLFSARRKMLRKGLSQMDISGAEELLLRLEIDPQSRPEELSPQRLRELFDAVWSG